MDVVSVQPGKAWESRFANMCREKGIWVQKMPSGSVFDLICNGHRVQCKQTNYIEKQGANYRRIRLARGSGCSASRNYMPGEFDFFAVLFLGDVYVMPAENIGIKNGRLLRRLSIPRLASYKDRFDLLRNPIAPRPDVQLEFFGRE